MVPAAPSLCLSAPYTVTPASACESPRYALPSTARPQKKAFLHGQVLAAVVPRGARPSSMTSKLVRFAMGSCKRKRERLESHLGSGGRCSSQVSSGVASVLWQCLRGLLLHGRCLSTASVAARAPAPPSPPVPAPVSAGCWVAVAAASSARAANGIAAGAASEAATATASKMDVFLTGTSHR